MGIVSRFERRLQGAVGDGLARVFGGGVVPKEVESALQREATDNVARLDGGRLLAPNSYVITVNSSDFEEFASDHDLTVRAFSRHLQDYIAEQGWQTYGDIRVAFEPSHTLHTGQFRTRGTVDPDIGRPPPAAPYQAPNQAQPPSRNARPPANPLSGAGPMTQNSGYDPRRADAENDRRGRAEYPGEPRGGARGFATPLSANRGGGYQNGGGYPEGGGRQGDQNGYQNGYDDRGQQGGGYGGGQGYGQGGYDDRGGYGNAGYGGQQGQGYGQGGYAEPGYADDRGGYAAEPSYGNDYGNRGGQQGQGYGQAGYAEPGYADDRGGYAAEPAYGAQGYQAPPAERESYAQPGNYNTQGYDQRQGGYAEPGYSAPPSGPVPKYQGGGGYGQPAQAAPGGYAGGFTATLQLDDGSGRTYQLREGSNIIGRGQDAHFRLPDTGVSRRHIEVRWDGQVAMLSDLGSTNGTLVNGSPVQDWQLADGDVIRAGHSEILIRIL